LAHKLRGIRESAGLSVDELANRAGVAPNTVRIIENESSPFKTHVTVAEAIATALSVSTDEIFVKEELSHRGRPAGTGKGLLGAVDVFDLSGATSIDVEVTVTVRRKMKVCPSCFLELPATGICDDCGPVKLSSDPVQAGQ
jgi:DNA-binding XRE family transcriptional regulator